MAKGNIMGIQWEHTTPRNDMIRSLGNRTPDAKHKKHRHLMGITMVEPWDYPNFPTGILPWKLWVTTRIVDSLRS